MQPSDTRHGEVRRTSASSAASGSSNGVGSSFSALRFQHLSISSRRRSSASSQSRDRAWGPLGLHVLHAPPVVHVEVIFVHGLRGGSIKTWCMGDSIELFWPREWLPLEPDLQHARIHSFGYNADWADSRESELDLHDFGRSLLAELITSPSLRQSKDTPILLVGHSMGGLVIKKAYLLARQDHTSRELSQRIRCMFFLATPHRGSDSARLLNNLLRASSWLSGRQYVNDIARNSLSLQIINDEFRAYADELHLWSFYETLKTKIGPTSSILIVDRDSAVIGFKNENAQPINADHRTICKFESIDDPNYSLFRNSLVKAVDDLCFATPDPEGDDNAMISSLESYLSIEYYSEDDLYNFNSCKSRGTCQWLTSGLQFRKWADTSKNVTTFWLRGMLGTGKSILSPHVASHLRSCDQDVALHFFKQGRFEQRTVASMLRHLAFQLAAIHPAIRKRLYELSASEVSVDKDDDQAIWRKLFVNEIFKTSLANPQFWVLDGVDECSNPAVLLGLINRVEARFPIRVFISSRTLPSIEKPFYSLQHETFQHNIQIEDTATDIRTYIQNSREPGTVSLNESDRLADRILNKAEGSFLWVKLALDELEHTYSDESMTEVLNDIPAEMTALYERVLDNMALNIREAKLTRAILEWTVCSARSLSATELSLALRQDLNINVPNIERSIHGLCGQFIRVEARGRVQIIHATARDFLLEQTKQQVFTIDGPHTHGRITAVCLNHLCGEDFRAPKMVSAARRRPGSKSALADYVAVSWTEHLTSTSSTDNNLFRLLVRFFRSNVLTWMEYIAQHKKNLWHLIRAAKNLRRYLDRRAKHVSPLGTEYAMINGWVTDIVRVVAKFGHHLLEDPQSIHFLIAPLCPSQSQIGAQFGSAPGRLSLSRAANLSWDDCIRYIDYRDLRATALAGGDNIFAIGFRNGVVNLYHKSTCQESGHLMHGELVRVIQFDHSSSSLATSGNKQLKLWTIDGQLVWSRAHQDPPVLIRFAPNDEILMVATKSSSIQCCHACDGSRATLGLSEDFVLRGLQKNFRQAILSCDISPDRKVVALAYRGRAVELWSIEDDISLGLCEKEALSVSEVVFNPNSSMEMLAVTYQDGELAIFDVWSRQEVATVAGEAYTMACTPDGRTVATGDMLGTIKIWDFETLHLLYCIRSPDYEVKALAFSGDGLQLYDIRDHKSKVWEPAVLIRKNLNDESSISDSVSISEPAPSVGSYGETVEITALLAPVDTDIILLGKDDGDVCVFDSRTGEQVVVLYKHNRDVLVTHLSWDATHSRVASADASSRILVWDVVQDQTAAHVWKTTSLVGEFRADGSVEQLAFVSNGDQLLVTTASSITLQGLRLDLASTEASSSMAVSTINSRLHYLWVLPVVSNTPYGMLLGLEVDAVRLLDVRASTETGIREIGRWTLSQYRSDMMEMAQRIEIDPTGEWLAIQRQQGPLGSCLVVYSLKHLEVYDAQVDGKSVLSPIACIPASKFKQHLGFHDDKLIYLDVHLWICSFSPSQCSMSSKQNASDADIEAQTKAATSRHFPVPFELFGSSNNVHGTVTRHGGVCFPRGGELAIVNNGLLSTC